jgi:hypothetical protein
LQALADFADAFHPAAGPLDAFQVCGIPGLFGSSRATLPGRALGAMLERHGAMLERHGAMLERHGALLERLVNELGA